MGKRQAIFNSGHGYWRTDRYPIGGEFRRAGADFPVELTGKRVESGSFTGYLEFRVLDGVQGAKGFTGWSDERAFKDLDWLEAGYANRT